MTVAEEEILRKREIDTEQLQTTKVHQSANSFQPRLLMASSKPPGRRLLQRLPVHPKPRLKELATTKPRTTTRRTPPNPSSEAAEPVEAARRRPSREAAEPAAMTRFLPSRIRAS